MLRDSFPEGPDGVRRGFPVETPVGVMYMNPVGWGVIVDNSSNSAPHREGRPYLTYHNVEFIANIGITNEGEIERCYISRRGSMSVNDDAAPTHRAAIIEAAKVAVAQWVSENPELVARAAYEQARMEHEGKVFSLGKAREDYDEAKKAERFAKKKRAKSAAALAALLREGVE